MGLLLLGGVVGIGGAFTALDQRARRHFITRTRTEWTHAGKVVRYGPVGAFYYGSRPHRSYAGRRVYGALGIMHDTLLFEGYSKRAATAFVRIQSIRWIGIRTLADSERHSVEALVIHSEDFNTWWVHVFEIEHVLEFANELSRYADLPLHQPGAEREDYGPGRASRMVEDIYGEWSEDRRGALYLAPGRLLFDWQDVIDLSQIREVSALVKGGLNPFASDLLRIEYEAPEPHVAGFLVRHAEKWADVIAQHAGVPVNIHKGRKKKES